MADIFDKQKFAYYTHDSSFLEDSVARTKAKNNKSIVFLKESGVIWTNDTSFGGNSSLYATKKHDSNTNEYGLGSAAKFGHVKLSDATNSDSSVDNGIAATPKAVKDVWNYASGKWEWDEASIKAVKVDNAAFADDASTSNYAGGLYLKDVSTGDVSYYDSSSIYDLLTKLYGRDEYLNEVKWEWNDASIQAVKVDNAKHADTAENADTAGHAGDASALVEPLPFNMIDSSALCNSYESMITDSSLLITTEAIREWGYMLMTLGIDNSVNRLILWKARKDGSAAAAEITTLGDVSTKIGYANYADYSNTSGTAEFAEYAIDASTSNFAGGLYYVVQDASGEMEMETIDTCTFIYLTEMGFIDASNRDASLKEEIDKKWEWNDASIQAVKVDNAKHADTAENADTAGHAGDASALVEPLPFNMIDSSALCNSYQESLEDGSLLFTSAAFNSFSREMLQLGIGIDFSTGITDGTIAYWYRRGSDDPSLYDVYIGVFGSQECPAGFSRHADNATNAEKADYAHGLYFIDASNDVSTYSSEKIYDTIMAIVEYCVEHSHGNIAHDGVLYTDSSYTTRAANYAVVTSADGSIISKNMSMSSTAITPKGSSGSSFTYISRIDASADGKITVESTNHTITAEDLGLTNALVFKGVTTTPIADGSTTNPIRINDVSVYVEGGNIVLYNNKEFVWAPAIGGVGTAHWVEMGDQGSYALKTVSISAGAGLYGGGTLEANRTISLAEQAGDSNEGGWRNASVSNGSIKYYNRIYTDGYGIKVSGDTINLDDQTGTSGNNGWYDASIKNGKVQYYNTNTNYYHTPINSSTGLKLGTGTGVSDMYIQYATTSQYGAIKLYDGTDSVSTELAATAKSVNTVYTRLTDDESYIDGQLTTLSNNLNAHIGNNRGSLAWYVN